MTGPDGSMKMAGRKRVHEGGEVERQARSEDDVSGGPVQPTISRRAVVLGAGSVAALALPFAKSPFGAVSPQGSIVGAVFDSRFTQSRDFAVQAGSLGIKPLGFAIDVSRLWFGELLPSLQSASRPIVGLTSRGALFCFEQLAWDVGMRVRFRIEHMECPHGFAHSASGDLPPSMLAALSAAADTFGRMALDFVLRCRPVWGNCTHAAVPPLQRLRSEPLVTWAIAPLRS